MHRLFRIFAPLALALALVIHGHAADPTWNYAVQVSATVARNPAAITLSWREDTTEGRAGYRPSYTVARKPVAAAEWGERKPVAAGQLTFRDEDVVPGVAYEYEVARDYRDPSVPDWDHVAHGYIVAGIDVAFPEQRGRVIVVVETSVANLLGDRVQRLRRDLIGDGWSVSMVEVAGSDAPERIRELVRNEYWAGGRRAEALLLLGRVPVARAGAYAPDGHESRAMPADAFYADIDGEWVDSDGDGIYDSDQIASDVELATGRVDFSALQGATPGRTEMDLLGQYLDKVHAFRHARLAFDSRALIGDRVGLDRRRAPAAAGYRTFSAFFGPDGIDIANTDDSASEHERWYSMLRRSSYLWALGTGTGAFDAIGTLGLEGQYKAVSAANLAADGSAAFYLLFGSYFVEWHRPNNVLRAALAAPEGGLGAAWNGRPSFFLHPMALGEPVGLSVRRSQNNETIYYSPANAFRRSVHIAWMGDPTLRMRYSSPPAGLHGVSDSGAVVLSWEPMGDAAVSLGHAVYRAASDGEPFARIGSVPPGQTTFRDPRPVRGSVYMVRAVERHQTASGTYENPSQGVFWTDFITGADPVDQSPSTADRLANLSARVQIVTANPARAPMVGFVVTGDRSREILVRAVGPTLSQFGVDGALAEPELQVLKGSDVLAANSGWADNDSIMEAARRVGAFPLPPGSRDAAVLIRVAPGAYTASVRASRGGAVLLEVYDAGESAGDAIRQLGNLSVRTYLHAGDGAIAGFVVAGGESRQVLVRAVGPALAAFGVGESMADPVLSLFDGAGNLLGQNDDWGTPQEGGATGGEIMRAAAVAGAFELPSGSRDSSLLLKLAPGTYTARMTGDMAGVGLIEVYEVR